MMKDFRKFTHAMPLAERTTVLFNANGFANTVNEKLAMAKGAKKARGAAAALYAAWPGATETHVFVVTPAEVVEALAQQEPVTITLTRQQAELLHTLASFDCTVPEALAACGEEPKPYEDLLSHLHTATINAINERG